MFLESFHQKIFSYLSITDVRGKQHTALHSHTETNNIFGYLRCWTIQMWILLSPRAGLALWVWCIFILKADVGEEEPSPPATPLPFKVECLVWPFQRTWPHSGMVLSILVLPLLASHLLFLQSFISEEHQTEKTRLTSTKADPANILHGFFSVLFWDEKLLTFTHKKVTEHCRWAFASEWERNVAVKLLEAADLYSRHLWTCWPKEKNLPTFRSDATNLHSNLKHNHGE